MLNLKLNGEAQEQSRHQVVRGLRFELLAWPLVVFIFSFISIVICIITILIPNRNLDWTLMPQGWDAQRCQANNLTSGRQSVIRPPLCRQPSVRHLH